jgi:hypothetical protein
MEWRTASDNLESRRFPTRAAFLIWNWLVNCGYQQKVERRGMVVHCDRNNSAVACKGNILGMAHIVMAAIGSDDAERLEGLLFAQPLNLLDCHT